MKRGTVIKSTGKWYVVKTTEGEYFDCRIRGKFRTAGIKTTNPLAVGDEVSFKPEDDKRGVIQEIHDRKNYIIRKSVNLSKRAHIVAANVDNAFLVVTVKEPDTSFGFIDRFLVTAEAYHIPTVIVLNKIDRLNEADRKHADELLEIYSEIGYHCIETSVPDNHNIEELKALMKDQTSVVSGHSGVGKSSLLNAVQPGLRLKTADVSDSHHKGQHTTTFAEMHELNFGGYIIDTPGIKGLGIVDVPKEELSHYFVEMRNLLPHCKFNNCVHINEPGCAVKDALAAELIAESRYKSYWNMYHNDDENPYR